MQSPPNHTASPCYKMQVYGRTPFADLAFIPKMHAICEPRHQIRCARLSPVESAPAGPCPVHACPDVSVTHAMHILSTCIFRTPGTQLSAICTCHFVIWPSPRPHHRYPPCSNPDMVDVMQRCLDRDPKTRITMPVRVITGSSNSCRPLLCAPFATRRTFVTRDRP